MSLLVLLVLVTAFLAARIIWLIVAPGPAVSPLTPRALPTPVIEASAASVQADLSLLTSANPFETSGEAVDAVPDAPETQLNLKLVALFMSTGETGGSATIVTPDNEATRFELGDEILPGVRLERILSDRVIISREGREETLMRGGREAGLSVISDPSEAQGETREVKDEEVPSFAPGVTATTFVAGLETTPEEQGGRVRAIALKPRGDASLMRAGGLEPGDRLVAINGTDVAGLETAALLDRFRTARTVRVSIVRAGQERLIDISFKEG
ncbi:type II secretion system protein N [Henriciella aquimarina]|uniref:type II secretion system protein N n=1 Tax=Henriciella aquimarina TaxID=545261 RepID=UPI001301DC74|nr:type II secretion system protein N [Henriciella aquimarina]